MHQLWAVLHRAVVAACDQEGLKIWLAMASILPFARHRVPLPWHGIVEYGYLAADKARLQAAFRKHGLETNVRRGILRCWFATGEPVRAVFGSRVLETCRSQTWPWADLFAYEDGVGPAWGAQGRRPS